jgi:hypothetical protein
VPSFESIQRYLLGAWRLMNGRADGLDLLDLSADGFWNSFFAMVVAVPALMVGWVNAANDFSDPAAPAGDRFAVFLSLALIDFCTWVLPLIALALAARAIGVADRFVHYVVASNWASALLVWIFVPPVLVELFVPESRDVIQTITLGLFIVSLVLSWRLTNVVLGKGAAVATAVFAAMFVLSFIIMYSMQNGLIGLPAQPAA